LLNALHNAGCDVSHSVRTAVTLRTIRALSISSSSAMSSLWSAVMRSGMVPRCFTLQKKGSGGAQTSA
jgi:hypothetical protein